MSRSTRTPKPPATCATAGNPMSSTTEFVASLEERVIIASSIAARVMGVLVGGSQGSRWSPVRSKGVPSALVKVRLTGSSVARERRPSATSRVAARRTASFIVEAA